MSKFWIPAFLVTLLTALFGTEMALRGRQLERMLREEAQMQARLEMLKAQNARARAERDALLSSPEAIEMVARTEYGFAAPGEQVTEIAPPPVPQKRPAPLKAKSNLWERILLGHLPPLALPALAFAATVVVLGLLNGKDEEQPTTSSTAEKEEPAEETIN